MKQYITNQQWSVLSQDKKQIWFEWAMKKGYVKHIFSKQTPFNTAEAEHEMDIPNIGQMIEFLMDHTDNKRKLNKHFENVKNSTLTSRTGLYFSDFANTRFFIDRDMTCDNLWEAVKEILKTHENKD